MSLEKMLKEVKALEDIESIKKMHNEYIFSLRNKQYEEMIECFADNAIVEIRNFGARTGKKEIAKLFRDNIAKEKNLPQGHSLVQPVITVKGETARGHWLLYNFHCDYTKPGGGGYLTKWEQGFYDCEYVRVEREWKFSHLRFICPWPEQP
jgi:hypothetical protein